MTDKQVRMVPDDELAAMIQQADDGFGYSMEMVRLVDGVRTYRLKIAGQETVEITDCEDNDYEASQACYRLISAAKNKVRADAIRTILAAAPSVQPDRGVIERLTKFANSLTGEFSSVVIPAKVAKQAADDIRSLLTVQKEEGK